MTANQIAESIGVAAVELVPAWIALSRRAKRRVLILLLNLLLCFCWNRADTTSNILSSVLWIGGIVWAFVDSSRKTAADAKAAEGDTPKHSLPTESSAQKEAEMDARQLLLEISSCQIARRHVENPNFGGPCSQIVATQEATFWASFQVPEPWSGHLLRAPILFLGSNPSISEEEAYPKGASHDSHLWNFFDDRFDGYWIQNGNQPRNQENTYGPPVRYWSSIRNRATELLGRDAAPGLDYVLSEIVHCKSEREQGVQAALSQCAERYLFRLLSCAGAIVVVLVGRKTLNYWNSLNMNPQLPKVPERDGTDPQQIAGRLRRVVYLAHPTGPEPKLFSHWLSEPRMNEIRAFVRNNA